MAANDPNLRMCPHICPNTPKQAREEVRYAEAGESQSGNPHAVPYVPGSIVPREEKIYPPGAPPLYLPQPSESTSGDILGMGPIGPWAAGHLDWNPTAGMTGVRPVVDKYSITRYSMGDWRRNNQTILTPVATDKGKNLEKQFRKDIANIYQGLSNKLENTNVKLGEKVKDLSRWKKKAQQAVEAISNELILLDENRTKLKSACKILMMPEAISRECLELRTNRLEPDLVRDDAEQELIKEVSIVGEIRRVFNVTLAKVENQMLENRAAKTALESDWSDKMVTLKNDKINLSLTNDSSLILFHPSAARWTEHGTSLEYWEHYCKESIRNCDEVRQKSENLRNDLMNIIIRGSQDMKLQCDRTDMAMAEANAAGKEMCDKLEESLKDNLQTIADIEKLIDYMKVPMRDIHHRGKLVGTRLHTRNHERPGAENCRDQAQYSLMAEAKYVKECQDACKDKLRQAEAIRAELMKYRGDLEKEIACKRKSLLINQDRCVWVRAFMPTPEEFANA